MIDSVDMTQKKDPYQLAREHALKRLDRRECSSGDIRQRLISKGFSEEVATQVIADLVQASFLSNDRFSKLFIRQQLDSGKGPHVIRQKLRVKGVDLTLEQVKAISAEVSQTTELQAAQRIVDRRYPNACSDQAERSRAFQALLRRGFSYSVAREALLEVRKED